MKLIEKIASRERCAEAGWFAFDYLLDTTVDRDFVLSLRPLGSLLLMDKLAKPFFKIEADHYIIKGLLNDNFFRVAVHKDHLDEIVRIDDYIKV